MDPQLLPAFNPGRLTGAGNNTYLLPGRVPALIDAGVGDPRHLDAIEAALNGARLARVLVTHAHPDHAAGAASLLARWPGAELCKVPWPDQDARYHDRWRPLADQALVAAGDRMLRVVHTPGHAPDHICLLDEADRTLYGGDLLVSGGTVVIPASQGGDLAAYLASLDRVFALAPRRVLPAHGPIIEEPAGLIREYRRHRADRERQILEALEHGERELAEIVRRVYAGLPGELEAAASESALAHLIKLEREGRVGRRGAAWHLLARRS